MRLRRVNNKVGSDTLVGRANSGGQRQGRFGVRKILPPAPVRPHDAGHQWVSSGQGRVEAPSGAQQLNSRDQIIHCRTLDWADERRIHSAGSTVNDLLPDPSQARVQQQSEEGADDAGRQKPKAVPAVHKTAERGVCPVDRLDGRRLRSRIDPTNDVLIERGRNKDGFLTLSNEIQLRGGQSADQCWLASIQFLEKRAPRRKPPLQDCFFMSQLSTLPPKIVKVSLSRQQDARDTKHQSAYHEQPTGVYA